MERSTKALVTLSTLACRAEFHEELAAAFSDSDVEALPRELIYEAFLQLYLFVGFPASLEAMKALRVARPLTHEAMPREPITDTEFAARGEVLFHKVYSQNADVVRDEMLRLSPELAARALVEGYGMTLSRPALSIEVRELCIVAILTQLGWKRQLFSHILGARNVGASQDDVLEAATIGCRGDAAKRELAIALLEKAFAA